MKLNFKLELLENAEGNLAFGFTHEKSGTFIAEPFLCTSGMEPIDPTEEYGISKEEADFIVKLNEALENATEDAVNAGCLAVQQAIGVTRGDYAGVYFSGDVERKKVREVFAKYMHSELQYGDNALED